MIIDYGIIAQNIAIYAGGITWVDRDTDMRLGRQLGAQPLIRKPKRSCAYCLSSHDGENECPNCGAPNK